MGGQGVGQWADGFFHFENQGSSKFTPSRATKTAMMEHLRASHVSILYQESFVISKNNF